MSYNLTTIIENKVMGNDIVKGEKRKNVNEVINDQPDRLRLRRGIWCM